MRDQQSTALDTAESDANQKRIPRHGEESESLKTPLRCQVHMKLIKYDKWYHIASFRDVGLAWEYAGAAKKMSQGMTEWRLTDEKGNQILHMEGVVNAHD